LVEGQLQLNSSSSLPVQLLLVLAKEKRSLSKCTEKQTQQMQKIGTYIQMKKEKPPVETHFSNKCKLRKKWKNIREKINNNKPSSKSRW